jgi:flavorubredoxin
MASAHASGLLAKFERQYWVGDRKLTAVRPPLFDNPTAIGIYDNKSEAFFSVDCFGAIIPLPARGKT